MVIVICNCMFLSCYDVNVQVYSLDIMSSVNFTIYKSGIETHMFRLITTGMNSALILPVSCCSYNQSLPLILFFIPTGTHHCSKMKFRKRSLPNPFTHDQPWASNPRPLDLVQHPIHHTHPKNPIHQVTTLLATSKDILFPGHNYLLTTSADDLARASDSFCLMITMLVPHTEKIPLFTDL